MKKQTDLALIIKKVKLIWSFTFQPSFLRHIRVLKEDDYWSQEGGGKVRHVTC